MTNLVQDVAAAAEANPDRTAVGFRGEEWSYEELWELTSRFAAGLAEHGVEAGDRVAVYLPNLPQFVTAFHGTLHAGGIVVPMNPQYKAREISHLLADSEARVVVALSDLVPFVDAVREETSVERVVSVGGEAEGAIPFEEFLADEGTDVVERGDDDVAVQPYTSGTTGRPKGVLLSHHNLAWDARATAKLLPDGVQADDRFLGVLPLFHIYGMTVTMLSTLFEGGSYYPLPTWDAEATLSRIEAEQLTVMHGVPAMFNDLVNFEDADDYDVSSLRFVNSGGSSLPIEVMNRFETVFGVELYEGYGLTETSPVTHANRPGERRPGSIGKPLDGLDARIVDGNFEDVPPVERGPVDEEAVDLNEITGELVVSGPNVMQGYYGLPEANEEAFTEDEGKRWFHTGDIGYRDEDDYYYVVDRAKHMIVTGGYNVYPREVEELLFEHPQVADAAVVGIPDDRRGETVKAYVVPVPDADVTPEEVKQYCLDNLAEYKHPREVEFIDELPRTTTGKVQKFELRERDGGGGTPSDDGAEGER
ncbi:long-chain fatty acid--CoA ligase [Halogeometricum sp. S1BR25-6]|uniref:Long-chain fatty acid--CoA ligase n=1 Tax=Halogeometricum salsisoli TaxID=2950536 RepID=A0ABU2GK93_9EURY|nr:long-chain fatty acid--CoA ligase [Halogeometricum sp. S1BR25-6]MDS0300488.1 long-chain fatty acid--CoA ligase [Halogeometricum sp. S1BR25-6]